MPRALYSPAQNIQQPLSASTVFSLDCICDPDPHIASEPFEFIGFDGPTAVDSDSASPFPSRRDNAREYSFPCVAPLSVGRNYVRPRALSLRIGERAHPISTDRLSAKIAGQFKSQSSNAFLHATQHGENRWKVLSEIAATNSEQVPETFGSAA